MLSLFRTSQCIYALALLMTGTACRSILHQNQLSTISAKGEAYRGELKDVRAVGGYRDRMGELLSDELSRLVTAAPGLDISPLKQVSEGSPDIKRIGAAAFRQLGYLQGIMRINYGTTLNVDSIVIKSFKLLPDSKFEMTYDASFLIFSRDVDSMRRIAVFPIDASRNNLKDIADKHPDCFHTEFTHVKSQYPADYDTYAFFYFNPSNSKCVPSADSTFQFETVQFTLEASAEKSTLDRRPEYKKIWADNNLNATLFFLPYEDGNKSTDPGVKAYGSFVSILFKKYGKPTETNIPNDFLSNGFSDYQLHPDLSARFRLDDKRSLNINLHFRNDKNESIEAFSADVARTSQGAEYFSYNGHAGYGSQVSEFEKAIPASPKQYKLVFLNGCASFGYQGKRLMQKADFDVDVLSNLLPTDFITFADTNMAVIDALVNGKKTYLDILKELSTLQASHGPGYDAGVVVRGEEDNLDINSTY